MKKRKTMGVETANFIQKALFEKKGIFLPFEDIRQMRRIPSESNSELYAVCLLKGKEEVMYVAKVCRRANGSIKKVFVAEHPPIREFAQEYCEEQKKGK